MTNNISVSVNSPTEKRTKVSIKKRPNVLVNRSEMDTTVTNVTGPVNANRSRVSIKERDNIFINQTQLDWVKYIGDLLDVDDTPKTDGSVLVYDLSTEKFVASTLLEKQTINGGNF